MALYDMTKLKGGSVITKDSLVRLSRTTFAQEGVQERTHLQAALRDHIDLIGPDLFVVAEEFGDFEGVNRRIDLLCIDKTARLVVVELKRTADGGHMELQAIRYAAMVSTMTFGQVVAARAKYNKGRQALDVSEESARAELLAWLDAAEDEEPEIPRDVGIVLASEDFSQEITTTVLWLNEFHDFDVRCVRLSPYKLEDRLLLDVQQVVPLPEASAYTVRVRQKENAVKQAKTTSADWTQFVVVTPAGQSDPLPKRWAMLRVVEALVEVGVPMSAISQVLPASKTLKIPGTFPDVDELWGAAAQLYDKSEDNRKRWHLDDPIVEGEMTWILNNNWGVGSREFFEALVKLAPPGVGIQVLEEGETPQVAP